MSATEFMTEGQKSRAQRDAAVVNAYARIRAEQPLVTRNRVLIKVGNDFGLVSQTIKGILRKYDAYK